MTELGEIVYEEGLKMKIFSNLLKNNVFFFFLVFNFKAQLEIGSLGVI